MTSADQLPPWPDDEWGRWLRPSGLGYGPMWVRPARVAETSPSIETLSEQRAVQILESWLFDSSERTFVHKLHGRLCGLSAHLEPERRWFSRTAPRTPDPTQNTSGTHAACS